MGHDQNLRESSVNVTSCFNICGNGEIGEFSLLFVILSEKLANFCGISGEIAKIPGIEHERDFTFWK